MGKMQREKGARGEREVTAIFRAHGLACDRTPNSGGLFIPGDVTGLDGLHGEVKRQETIEIRRWMQQAWIDAATGEREPHKTPFVAFRKSDTPANFPLGQWHVCLPLEDFAAMVAQLSMETDAAKYAKAGQ